MAGNQDPDSQVLIRNESSRLDPDFDLNDPRADIINEAGNMGRARSRRRQSKRMKDWHYNFQEAGIYLQEGENNDKYSTHPRNHDALPAYEIAHNHWFYLLDLAAAFLCLVLAACERPAYHYFQLPVGVHGSLEIFGLLVLGLELGIRMKWLGWRVYVKHPRTMFKSVMLTIMFIEAVVVLIRQTNHFRVTRALRPVFLLDSHYCRGLRRMARQTLQSLPPILDMIGLLLFVMLIFSILGFYLLSQIPGDTYFTTLQGSFISLFVLLTTANYPDVMMPAYNANRFYALFFIVYLSIELYFIMNLLLAVVYDTFSGLEKTKLKKLFFHKRQGCQFAFRLLVTTKDPKHISLRAFMGVMTYFRPKISRRDGYLLFKALNTERSGKLSLEEFYRIYEFCDLVWKPFTSEASLWSSDFKQPYRNLFKGLHWFVSWKWFDGFIFNNVALKEYNFANTDASIFFVSVYCLESAVKILGRGPKDYFTSGWDVFDFLVTITSLVGVLGQAFADSFYYITILRPFRLLRLFKIKKRYRDVLGTFFVLMNRLTSLVSLIILVYYAFAIIGMEVFLNRDLTNCCKNTSVEQFYRSDNKSMGYYYLNNFENIFISGVTLFELTVINNWFIIMDGYAFHVGEWSRVFFMFFYLVMMVVMTIVVAFILELFLFRITYRRQMHLDDIDDHEKYRLDICLDDEEEAMCSTPTAVMTGNCIINQSTRPPHTIQVNRGPGLESPQAIRNGHMYRGERMRSKEDFSLRMYADELKGWIEEERKGEIEMSISGIQSHGHQPRQSSQIM